MEHLSFTCQWHNPDGNPCFRHSVKGSTFCKWHLMESRITLLHLGNSSQTRFRQYIDVVIVCFLLYICIGLFYSTWGCFAIFGSPAYVDAQAAYNPSFAFLFLGLALMFFAELILIYKGYLLPFEDSWFSCILFCVISLALVIAFRIAPFSNNWLQDYLQGLSKVISLLPVALIVHRIERRKGLITLVIFLAGTGCILFSGIIKIIAEVLFRLTGHFDLIPHISPEERAKLSGPLIAVGITYCTVAVDVLIGIYKGYMITPFSSKKGVFQRLFREQDGENFLAFITWLCFLFIVLYGQGQILRQLLFQIFKRYMFDVIPFPDLFHMLLVVAIHYFINKRLIAKRENSVDSSHL